MACEYVRDYYRVPAEIGRRVIAYGKPGIIAEDRGNYIGVNFDDAKPGHIDNCHPTDHIEYLDEFGTPRPMGRAQKRYHDYLDADCGLTFAEWLGIR